MPTSKLIATLLAAAALCVGCTSTDSKTPEAVAPSAETSAASTSQLTAPPGNSRDSAPAVPLPWKVQGPLVVSQGRSNIAMDALVGGEVSFTGPCITLRDYPVVWPEGTSWDEAAGAIVLPDGSRALPGSVIGGAGGYGYLRDVPAGSAAEVTSRLKDCLGPTGEVAYFNLSSSPTLQAQQPA